MPGSAIPQVMIATRFAAPADAVYAVVTDYAHFAEFIPDVAESRIIREADGVQWVFHRLHFAGPVADRVYVMRSVGSVGAAAYRVEWSLSPEAPPAGAQGISPRQFSGFWELRPTTDGKATEARYAVHSDPGGRIPAWLVTRIHGEAPGGEPQVERTVGLALRRDRAQAVVGGDVDRAARRCAGRAPDLGARLQAQRVGKSGLRIRG